MADAEKPKPAHERPAPERAQLQRLEREAAALRQNLLRRKQQARARESAKPDAEKT
ncbi:MAG TPA: hypothetical protein VE650_11570 [Acetobacteraceae bacterium]|nr:hypothetical protein [Acetobacteraceae bacterium]